MPDPAPLSDHLRRAIAQLASRHALDAADITACMEDIFSAKATPAQTGAFLFGLQQFGLNHQALFAAGQFLRTRMTTCNAPHDAVDNCGTGGDGLHTLNISTAAALIAATCGVPMAKHGNRAASSQSGSADVLEKLGIRIDLTPDDSARQLSELNFTFLMAPRYHPILQHVSHIRRELGTRTIFNALAPTLSPARVKRQVMGVYDATLQQPLAEALRAQGSAFAWVIHAEDGMDEISLAAPTHVWQVREGEISHIIIDPKKLGLPQIDAAALRGGDVAHNTTALLKLASGEPSAYADISCLNAAALLLVAEKCSNLEEGLDLALKIQKSGAVAMLIQQLQQWKKSVA